MDERRRAWEERGWENYVHVEAASANGSTKATKIPIRVYGEHIEEAVVVVEE